MPTSERRPITLRAPITLGVVLIVLVVILGAMWVTGTLWGALRGQASPELFWAMLFAGSVLLIAVLAGVIAYLTLSVKAFNLNRRQSNFIDAVTHELKSPIASLKLYLQTMTRHSVNEKQKAEFHKIMLDDVERLDSLINHLLEAARVERGEKAEDASPIPLADFLAQVSSAASVRYKLPAETIQIDCPDITVTAPPVQLEILFRNLVDNAIKYGGSPPRVRISAKMVESTHRTGKPPAAKLAKVIGRGVDLASGPDSGTQPGGPGATGANSAPATGLSGEVTISVGDNGKGIPANLRRKVFGRFVRLGNELERSSPGTGLGLHLVRNVTHALGGRINIGDSSGMNFDPPPAPGTPPGTRFDITLPLAVHTPSPVDPAPADESGSIAASTSSPGIA